MEEHDPRDYLGFRDLSDGRHIDLMPLTFDRVRLAVSPDDRHHGIDDVYDYDTFESAYLAMTTWEGFGDPPGWRRAATQNERNGFRRRSDPDDPNSEQVRP